jgi:hypothetical protein
VLLLRELTFVELRRGRALAVFGCAVFVVVFGWTVFGSACVIGQRVCEQR